MDKYSKTSDFVCSHVNKKPAGDAFETVCLVLYYMWMEASSQVLSRYVRFRLEMLSLLIYCVLVFLLSSPGFWKLKPCLSKSLDQVLSFKTLIEIQLSGI